MRETLELRIPEEKAGRVLSPTEGIGLGKPVPWIRKVTIPLQDSRAAELNAVALGWQIRRTYTAKELAAAELLHLEITSTFEPAGEECGTVYDETSACHYREDQTFPMTIPGGGAGSIVEQRCGAGRKQVSELRLNLRRVPKGKDLCRTIADEWLVSERLAVLLGDAGATGFELHPVHHLSETAPSTSWYQLVIAEPRIRVVSPTVAGIRPFDLDVAGAYRCPLGHVIGLNLLSELHVSRDDWTGNDLVCTREEVGVRRGLLVPAPLLLVSQRVRGLLGEQGVKGCRLEVAYLH
jgi:hypothetical protein